MCSLICDPLSPFPRDGRIASISSKKMIVGADWRAFLNISRMLRSDSPTHFERSSGPFTVIKFISLSVASALASRVFYIKF